MRGVMPDSDSVIFLLGKVSMTRTAYDQSFMFLLIKEMFTGIKKIDFIVLNISVIKFIYPRIWVN
jgi:hypothetical protein